MKQIVIRFVVVIALCILVTGRASAATGKEGAMAKVGHDLAVLYDEYESYQAQGGGAKFKPSDGLVPVIGGRVVIDAVASGDVQALQADLEALGMQGAVAFGRIVSGQLPISVIEGMATLASLQFARPAYATTNVGLVTNQGDQAMRADVARTTFGVEGTGVTVGVLSDSFDCLGGVAADVASEDLSPVTVIQELPGCGGATDEGRAMLQLVHDVAPGASLAFATAFTGQASFARNILALQAAGAGVIVDDLSSTSPSRCSRTGSSPKPSIPSRGWVSPISPQPVTLLADPTKAAFASAPFSRIVPSRQLLVPRASLGVRHMTLTRGRAKTFSSASRFPPALGSPSPSSGTRHLPQCAPAVPAPPTISTSMCSMTRPRPSWPAARPPIPVGTRWRSSASSIRRGRR